MGINGTKNPKILVTKVEVASDLSTLMEKMDLTGDPLLIKVNWFGPEYGYFTDARTLDFVLQALPPGEKIIIEGHAYGRNDGSRDIDWRDPELVKASRGWIQEQEAWFLESTGLAKVIAKHKATYINITDEVWASQTIAPHEVKVAVEDHFTPVAREELYSFVPSKIWDLRGTTLLSLSRIKLRSTSALAEDDSPFSPIFSLSMKNLFGLIPDPFRYAWHGTGGEELAQSILDINKVYSALFDVVGLNEGIFHLLINDPTGKRETNWGNYDILEDHGIVLLGRDLISLDTYTASMFFSIDWNRWPFFKLAEPDFGQVDETKFPSLPSELQDLISACSERYLLQRQIS